MIDGGPLRTSRPAGRQVMYRNEPARQQSDEEYPPMESVVVPAEQPRQTQQYRQAEPEQTAPRKPRSFSWVKWVVLLLGIVLLAVAGWYFWASRSDVSATIDTGKYQAVFLSNGQVYFGKLSIVTGGYMKLTNVFYLERQLTTADTGSETDAKKTANDTTNPTGDNNFQLLKYSDVLYGSEDAMIISKDDVIRFENLRSDGVVAKAIANRS